MYYVLFCYAVVFDKLEFERTDSSYTYVANITNRGVLRMFNTFARSFVKLLTHTSNNSVLTRIGQVVCREFGFAKLVDTQAIPFSEQSQTTINSVGGLNCMGHETSIKECKSAPIGDNPYEVEVECQCKYCLYIIKCFFSTFNFSCVFCCCTLFDTRNSQRILVNMVAME